MDSDAEHRPEQRIRLQAVTAVGRGEGFYFLLYLSFTDYYCSYQIRQTGEKVFIRELL